MNYYCVTAPYCALAEDDKCRMLQREAFVFSVAQFFFFYILRIYCVYTYVTLETIQSFYIYLFLSFSQSHRPPFISVTQLSFRISKLEFIFNTDAKWVTSMKR